jgi:hypothetical protein
VLASAPRVLLGGTRVYSAVRQFSDGRLGLSISDGNGVEHVSAQANARLEGSGSCSIRSGNNAGDRVAAQVYLEDVLIQGCALTSAEIEQRFAEPRLKGYQGGP